MNRSTRHPALARLDVLEGEWTIEATVGGQKYGGGHASFTWTDDGAFLVQHANSEKPPPGVPVEWVENSPEPVTTIIGLDDSTEQFTMLYADARDVFRVYQMILNDGDWKVWRDAPGFFQRFSATVHEDGNVIEGTWEASEDGTDWNLDFHLTYTRSARGAG